MQTAEGKELMAPLILFLWAGYLFFGAYYQHVYQEAFPGFSPALFLIAGTLGEKLPLQVCSVFATVLGACFAACGVWVASCYGKDSPKRRDE